MQSDPPPPPPHDDKNTKWKAAGRFFVFALGAACLLWILVSTFAASAPSNLGLGAIAYGLAVLFYAAFITAVVLLIARISYGRIYLKESWAKAIGRGVLYIVGAGLLVKVGGWGYLNATEYYEDNQREVREQAYETALLEDRPDLCSKLDEKNSFAKQS